MRAHERGDMHDHIFDRLQLTRAELRGHVLERGHAAPKLLVLGLRQLLPDLGRVCVEKHEAAHRATLGCDLVGYDPADRPAHEVNLARALFVDSLAC